MTDRHALFVGSKQLGLKALQAMAEAIPGRVAGAVTIDDSTDNRQYYRIFKPTAGMPAYHSR